MKNLMIRLALAAIAVCSTSMAAADPVDDVRCREIGFSRAAEARDADAFRSYIDADARFVGSTVLRGPDAIVDAWRPFFEPAGPAIKWRPRIVEILDDGLLALTRGPYRVRVTSDDGESTEQWGTFNSVWRLNNDGTWRVVFDAGTPTSEAPSDADRELLETDTGCPPAESTDSGSS